MSCGVGEESNISIGCIGVSCGVGAESIISYCYILISSRGNIGGSIECLVSDSHIVVGSICCGSTRTSVESLSSDSSVGSSATIRDYLVGSSISKGGMIGTSGVEPERLRSIRSIVVSSGVGVEGTCSIRSIILSSGISTKSI